MPEEVLRAASHVDFNCVDTFRSFVDQTRGRHLCLPCTDTVRVKRRRSRRRHFSLSSCLVSSKTGNNNSPDMLRLAKGHRESDELKHEISTPVEIAAI
jgi:hypothetical protein